MIKEKGTRIEFVVVISKKKKKIIIHSRDKFLWLLLNTAFVIGNYGKLLSSIFPWNV